MKQFKLKIHLINLDTGEEIRIDECVGSVDISCYEPVLIEPGFTNFDYRTKIEISAKTTTAITYIKPV